MLDFLQFIVKANIDLWSNLPPYFLPLTVVALAVWAWLFWRGGLLVLSAMLRARNSAVIRSIRGS